MKAVVFAYHNIGCVGIDALIAAGVNVLAVFTHKDDELENIFFHSVAYHCAQLQLPVYAPSQINHPTWIKRIQSWAPDFIFSFYYRKLLCQQLLKLAPYGAYNLHGSLLPRYRGCSPVNWVIIHGETETGVTLHKMIARADAGDIVAQQKVPINQQDTALTLHQKLSQAAKLLLNKTLPQLILGNIALQPQSERYASYYGRRTPNDGMLDWQLPAKTLYNLIRAITLPYPGAFTFIDGKQLTIWQACVAQEACQQSPGKILSLDPLKVACGQNSLIIHTGTLGNGVCLHAKQLVTEANFKIGQFFSTPTLTMTHKKTPIRVLILGVNGFIGNHLTERLLGEDHYEIYGLDINDDAIERFSNQANFHFTKGDISIYSAWIKDHIKKCDVVLPLVAVATPMTYIKDPLHVFELDFEENLKIIRYCVKYGKRIIFPSTSEVYGMCQDQEFHEDHSQLTVGPIRKQRWIYSISKQLLDRVIWAYGKQHNLRFTIFRPFNWIGPRLDSLKSAHTGNARVITQFILSLVQGLPIQLVDGGKQKRSFTDIEDGINALFQIIEDLDQQCNAKIINIGNPNNEFSIQKLATLLVGIFTNHPLRNHFPPFAGFKSVSSSVYYGRGYQDMTHRRPSITKAQQYLNWSPKISIETTIEKTLDFFLRQVVSTASL